MSGNKDNGKESAEEKAEESYLRLMPQIPDYDSKRVADQNVEAVDPASIQEKKELLELCGYTGDNAKREDRINRILYRKWDFLTDILKHRCVSESKERARKLINILLADRKALFTEWNPGYENAIVNKKAHSDVKKVNRNQTILAEGNTLLECIRKDVFPQKRSVEQWLFSPERMKLTESNREEYEDAFQTEVTNWRALSWNDWIHDVKHLEALFHQEKGDESEDFENWRKDTLHLKELFDQEAEEHRKRLNWDYWLNNVATKRKEWRFLDFGACRESFNKLLEENGYEKIEETTRINFYWEYIEPILDYIHTINGYKEMNFELAPIPKQDVEDFRNRLRKLEILRKKFETNRNSSNLDTVDSGAVRKSIISLINEYLDSLGASSKYTESGNRNSDIGDLLDDCTAEKKGGTGNILGIDPVSLLRNINSRGLSLRGDADPSRKKIGKIKAREERVAQIKLIYDICKLCKKSRKEIIICLQQYTDEYRYKKKSEEEEALWNECLRDLKSEAFSKTKFEQCILENLSECIPVNLRDITLGVPDVNMVNRIFNGGVYRVFERNRAQLENIADSFSTDAHFQEIAEQYGRIVSKPSDPFNKDRILLVQKTMDLFEENELYSNERYRLYDEVNLWNDGSKSTKHDIATLKSFIAETVLKLYLSNKAINALKDFITTSYCFDILITDSIYVAFNLKGKTRA